MADIDKIKIGSTTYNISPSGNNITDKPSTYPPSSHTHTKSQITDFSHTHTKSEVGLGNVDNTADANKNVNYANSAGSVAWDNISSKPITITQRNNDSPVSGAYAYGTYVTMSNTNNGFEIYAPHMGTSSSRVYMQTGWDNNRQGGKAIAWTSDIPTSLPASDVYDGAKASTKPSYSWSEINNKPSTFTPSSHEHSSILDSANAHSTYFAYSKDGLNYDDYTGLAAWDNYELRAVNKSQFARASHTHDDRYYTESEVDSKLSGKSDTNHTHSYLPLSGGALTGTLNLTNSANGIKFNSKSHYITNIQAGSVSITLSSSSGSTATNTVNFQDYSKGNGSWYIVTTVNSSTTYPESVITCVSSVTSRYFTVKAKRIASVSGGNPTIGVDYIAIKFS